MRAFLSITGLVCLLAHPASSAQNSCAAAALVDYNKQNLAILQQGSPIMTVQAQIAQRRLQEQFCLRVAQCRVGDPSNQALGIAHAAAFSACLREEADQGK